MVKNNCKQHLCRSNDRIERFNLPTILLICFNRIVIKPKKRATITAVVMQYWDEFLIHEFAFTGSLKEENAACRRIIENSDHGNFKF